MKFIVTWFEPGEIDEERVEVIEAVDAAQARRLAGHRVVPGDPIAGEELVSVVPADPASSESKRPQPGQVLYSLRDAATLTGISRSTLETLYASGKITRYTKSGRPGGDRLVDVADVKNALRVDSPEATEREIVDRIIDDLIEAESPAQKVSR
ncbi:MAG: hypothetical protein AAF449_07475 [Myxococcota bacterium]